MTDDIIDPPYIPSPKNDPIPDTEPGEDEPTEEPAP